MLNDPRPNKKLLVLDIDYTFFDHRSTAASALELKRPFINEMLVREIFILITGNGVPLL